MKRATRAVPAPGHQTQPWLANELLLDVLASFSQTVDVGWHSESRQPVVEAFGVRYWLSGTFESGWLSPLPFRRSDKPVLRLERGVLMDARRRALGSAFELVSFVLASPPATRRRRSHAENRNEPAVSTVA
jgi:hypothetical protein